MDGTVLSEQLQYIREQWEKEDFTGFSIAQLKEMLQKQNSDMN